MTNVTFLQKEIFLGKKLDDVLTKTGSSGDVELDWGDIHLSLG